MSLCHQTRADNRRVEIGEALGIENQCASLSDRKSGSDKLEIAHRDRMCLGIEPTKAGNRKKCLRTRARRRHPAYVKAALRISCIGLVACSRPDGRALLDGARLSDACHRGKWQCLKQAPRRLTKRRHPRSRSFRRKRLARRREMGKPVGSGTCGNHLSRMQNGGAKCRSLTINLLNISTELFCTCITGAMWRFAPMTSISVGLGRTTAIIIAQWRRDANAAR